MLASWHPKYVRVILEFGAEMLGCKTVITKMKDSAASCLSLRSTDGSQCYFRCLLDFLLKKKTVVLFLLHCWHIHVCMMQCQNTSEKKIWCRESLLTHLKKQARTKPTLKQKQNHRLLVCFLADVESVFHQSDSNSNYFMNKLGQVHFRKTRLGNEHGMKTRIKPFVC